MKHLLRRLSALMLALLLTFSLLPGQAAGHDIADLGADLLDAQIAYDVALADYAAGRANGIDESVLDHLMSLQAEHHALLMIAEDCETLMLEHEGKFAYLLISVTLDPDMVIYDMDVAVEGSDRDQAVSDLAFLYQFIGKDLPLTIGTSKKDDIRPAEGAQQTSKDVVDALNDLVHVEQKAEEKPRENGPIIEPQAIADYLFAHGRLPNNFITKKEAQKMGWDSSYNDVSDVAPGYSIGGDRFGNYEGRLPDKKGRTWYEADCYYTKGNRNAHRILYSNDGLVYYTDDHYETFTQMHPSK